MGHIKKPLRAGCSMGPALSLVGLGITMAIAEIKEADGRGVRVCR